MVKKALMDLQGSYFVRPDLVMFLGAWCGHHALVRRYYTEVGTVVVLHLFIDGVVLRTLLFSLMPFIAF